MHVALGPHRFDVTHRAVVVAADDPTDGPADDPADESVAGSADAVLGRDVTDTELVALGALYLPLPPPDEDPATTLARQALAVTRGARVVATRDVRATRRVVDVLAAILSRR